MPDNLPMNGRLIPNDCIIPRVKILSANFKPWSTPIPENAILEAVVIFFTLPAPDSGANFVKRVSLAILNNLPYLPLFSFLPHLPPLFVGARRPRLWHEVLLVIMFF